MPTFRGTCRLKGLCKFARMDCEVCELMVNQATPRMNEDTAAELRLDDQTQLDRDALDPMVEQAAPCADEYSAPKLRLDAQALKELDHAEKLLKRTVW